MADSDKIHILKKGEKAARSTALIQAFLGMIKGGVALLSGSIALLADAVHSVSDVIGSLAVWLGLRLAQKKPTEMFRYGYYKAETLASLAVSVIILVSAIEIFVESLEKIFMPPTISLQNLAMVTAGVSAVFSYLLARYKERIGREINSQALVGEGKHSMIDVCLSLTVLGGILCSRFGLTWVEPLAAVLISLFIGKLGFGLAKDAVLVLMDVSVKPRIIDEMKGAAEKVPGVKAVHAVKMRRSGPFIFGEMHLEVEETIDVDKAQRISDEVQGKVRESRPEVDSLTIHVEPARKERFRVAIPIAEDRGLESTPHPHLGRAPFFLFVDITEGRIEGWFVKENPGSKLDRKRGMAAGNLLVEEGISVLVTKGVGAGPFHSLRDRFVKIYELLEGAKISDILEAILKDELKPIKTPE